MLKHSHTRTPNYVNWVPCIQERDREQSVLRKGKQRMTWAITIKGHSVNILWWSTFIQKETVPLYTMSSAQLNVCLRFNSVFISFKTGISSADISYHQHFCISLDFYFVALSQCCFLLFYLMVSECFCHRCLKAAFPEKHWLLAWAHKVTESRLKARHPASILHLGPLLWAILSCSHFAAILKPRKNLTTCQVSMTLIVTRPHLTNPETMSC
jgi:hypothetical protein